MENKGKYVLITGATSGIGYELARLFAKDQFDLIIVARHADELEKTANSLIQEFGIEVIPIAGIGMRYEVPGFRGDRYL
jgi:short-subunit dehydrogenase